MDLASGLLFLALLLLVALFVARPLLQETEQLDEHNEAADSLAAERERVLDALAELDADWELGKVPEDIYRGQRQQLVAEGAAALRQLEQHGGEIAVPHAKSIEISDAKLEALITSRKSRTKKGRK